MTDLLSQAKASPQFLSQLRELSQKSLYFFVRAILGFDKLTSSLHLPLCNFIQDLSVTRKLILMPRGHYKTTCGSIGFILWLIIQDKIPGLEIPGVESRILLAKENATLAEHDLNALEETLDNNQLFQLLFPKIVPDRSKRKRWNAQEMLVNRESSWPEATVETIGVGGAKQGTHYDIIIYDDIIGDKAKDSETVMDATTEWFVYSESLFISLHKGISNVLGTRWSKRDVYQHILERDKRFRPYTRQAIEDGAPIFPEQFPLETLLDIMNRNIAHWSSQYCNNPTDPTKCDFKESWLKFYEWERQGERLYLKLQDDEKLVPWTELDLVGSFDPSIDEKPTASKRAITYQAMDSRERVYLIDEYSSREPLEKVLDVIYSTHTKWSPREFAVEKAALQKVFVWILERENRLRKHYISCVPVQVSTTKSKEARIRDTIQPLASEGRLYIRKCHFEFLQEYIDFPQGRTKDILDAFSNGLKLLRLPLSEQEEAEELEAEERATESRSSVTGY